MLVSILSVSNLSVLKLSVSKKDGVVVFFDAVMQALESEKIDHTEDMSG